MILVADSSAMIALAACECLYLLDELFKEVRVPAEVYNEIALGEKPFSVVLKNYLHNKVVEISVAEIFMSDFTLGKGELHAMSLYKKLSAERLLIDDRRARKIAQLNNIDVIGSIGILLLAKQENIIQEVKPLLKRIHDANIFISSELYLSALKIAGEN